MGLQKAGHNLVTEQQHFDIKTGHKNVVSHGQKNRKKQTDKQTKNTKESLGMQKQKKKKTKKNRLLSSFPPPCCNHYLISGPSEQYNLSPLRLRRRHLPYSSPHPVYVPHLISKWTVRTLSCFLYPGYKNGPRSPVQHLLSLEPACCSNSISQCNKFYFPLILSHIWKFFSNPCMDHDKK